MLSPFKWGLLMGTPLLLLVIIACGGGPAPTPSPTPTEPMVADDVALYRMLVDRAMNDTADITRLLSRVGIELSTMPDRALQAEATVNLAKETLEDVQVELTQSRPPASYDEVHQALLDALGFYIQAAAALLPDHGSGSADYWSFQGFMQEGGKNFHGAGNLVAELSG